MVTAEDGTASARVAVFVVITTEAVAPFDRWEVSPVRPIWC